MSQALIKKPIRFLTAFISLLMLSTPVIAEQLEQRTSKSISFAKSENLDKSVKDEKLDDADTDVMESIVKEGFRMEAAASVLHIDTYNTDEIYVYDTYTDLISDYNHDGFYRRLSVAIDVDTVFDTSYIYTRMYLSLEGGPWNHYATSNNYHIHGDSDADIFIIETELADGFPPGYYDVKIEVYDAHSGYWLSSYGPYDDSSLANLPLEDSYYDGYYNSVYPVETEVIVAGHAGALSWWLLLAPVITLFIRKKNPKLTSEIDGIGHPR